MASSGILYDLSHYNTTWANSGMGNSNSQNLLDKWPYLCSRNALIYALGDVATGSVTQRNPNGYTAAEMADKIINMFDQIMFQTWNHEDYSSTTYHPSAMNKYLEGYRWDQKSFWNDTETYFIFNDGDSDGDADSITDDHSEIVLLPSKAYDINSKAYKAKPYLSHDPNLNAISNVSRYGAELDVNGSNQVTGIDVTSPTRSNYYGGGNMPTDMHANLLFIKDYDQYHDTLAPAGSDDSAFNGSKPAATGTWEDSTWKTKRYAKFSVVVSGGVVTTVTAVSRTDGDGGSVTGGWDYESSDDYVIVSYDSDDWDEMRTTDATKIQPRFLFRTDEDSATGLPGKKATVTISEADSEFYEGKGLTDGTYDAYAIHTLGSGSQQKNYTGESRFVEPQDYTNWYDITLPQHVLPSSVRFAIERPNLKTKTRSLKTRVVGTGAHRYSFEFEYPPMTESEADAYIDFFEKARGGARECQVAIPKTCFDYIEHQTYEDTLDVIAEMLEVTGSKGDSDISVRGNSSKALAFGTLFLLDNKLYRVVEYEGANTYGEARWRIEPPLLEDYTNAEVRGRTTQSNRSEYLYMKVLLMDDTLDYTVDAAGHFRLRFKFVETR